MRKFILVCLVLASSMLALGAQSGSATTLPDTNVLPQNANAYITTATPILDSQAQSESVQNFLMQLYSPWFEVYPRFNLATLNSWYDGFEKNPGVGQNLAPLTASYFQNFQDITNSSSFGKLLIPAMVIRNSNLRVAPTMAPRYSSSSSTSFDSLQCTSIYYGTPVVIIGETEDKSWYFVESGMQADGWIPASDIALVSKSQVSYLSKWKNYMTFSGDNLPIKNQKGVVISEGKIGMILPLVSQKSGYHVIAFGKDASTGYLELVKGNVSNQDGNKFPYIMTQGNVAFFMNQLISQPYGWGGNVGYRDCSLMQKDLMAEFGIFLNRNSGNLLNCGKVIKLSGLSNSEKLNVISLEGVPFRTLLIMKGHVMLYIGNYHASPVMFHQYWAAHVVTADGKLDYYEKQSEITYVNIGVQNPDIERSTILTAINAMVILGE